MLFKNLMSRSNRGHEVFCWIPYMVLAGDFAAYTGRKTEGEIMQRKRSVRRKTLQKRGAAAVMLAAVLPLLLMGAASGHAAEELVFPLAASAYRISDGYGWRSDPFTGKRRFHEGIDLACAQGSAVLAAKSGVVVAAKRSESYGNYLRICHADDTGAVYAHLEYLYVREGEVVAAGQCLGTVGQTGRATGAHLHFELYQSGLLCDPAQALGLSDA